ncbi:HAMP domain-containing histidine kinase [Chitinophagaceae bacterium LB-8]|uniref:histidine kinase n=1 Tax=Paraflavisolibacter caeni TaxID=2982496 RepID=A0A9X3BKD8_9BACT|nr:HAMP domain-containing sensor histidine kinase [Paraflavisolibacter caeni]MCU7552773.1 HAMP domain-containing histidine kinase [Paraflavisolibacter caeni]
MKNIKWLPIVMAITILGIAIFQLFWLKNTFEREKRTLEIRSNFTFRDVVHSLQASKIDFDKWSGDSITSKAFSELKKPIRIPKHKEPERPEMNPGQKMLGMLNMLREKIIGNQPKKMASFKKPSTDSIDIRKVRPRQAQLIQLLYEMDSLQDTLDVKEMEILFGRRMDQQNFDVPFTIKKVNKSDDDRRTHYNEVTIGFSNPVAYRLQLGNTTPYLMKRISAAILLSLFIVGFTAFSFFLLYRNILKQRKLAEIKNDFISNITHELKTPIATVSVAIEALRTFNANLDPARTKEYLDISHNELQRLSLLVDKVLKLSMFEKKEIDLKLELLNMKDLIQEVTSSMRLQFEKRGAQVSFAVDGDTSLKGDRLHLVSVIFNLLDNALKYSRGTPQIQIVTKGEPGKVQLIISDNGIGIPREFQDKVFDKFFRVPTGNLHNAKGYGLGLSYVAHVIQQHNGTISIDSIEGTGSRFVIHLPKHEA